MYRPAKFLMIWARNLGITFGVVAAFGAVVGAIAGTIAVANSYGGEIAGMGAFIVMLVLAGTAASAWDDVS